MNKKLTLPQLQAKKSAHEPVTFLTCYDFPMAQLCEAAGIDLLLVGDSVGMTTLGYDTTLPVTMEEMLHHCRAVRRGAPNTFLIGDMPLGSYQISNEEAVRNAIRFIKEGGCDAIKCEGGNNVIAQRIEAMAKSGLVVMGHLGMTPQSYTQQGGYRVQGRDDHSRNELVLQARELEKSGLAFLLLEGTPPGTGQAITKALQIPVYGIGAGPLTDGQLLILHDVIGLFQAFKPRFARRYCEAGQLIQQAIGQYIQDVKRKEFPSQEYWYD